MRSQDFYDSTSLYSYRDNEKSVSRNFALHPNMKNKMTEPTNFLKINLILSIRNIPKKSTFPQRLRF